MKRTHRAGVRPAITFVLAFGVAAPAFAQLTGGEALVTDRPYLRQDGGADATIVSCSSDEPMAGGSRQQNEPTVAINPKRPTVIAAGANDYCTTPTIGDAWMGFYVSTNGGVSWLNSLNPGYPTDTSAAGQASPIFGRAGTAGDPLMDWDNEDRLFYGGISFNRTLANASGFVTPANGDVFVSTWVYDPGAPLSMRYLRTVIVGQGSSGRFPFAGKFNDKPSLRVDDWEGSPNEGNVYISWTLFPGAAGADQVLFARSTDHGQTFSHPIKISKSVANAQGSDIAVAPDGTIYVVWRQFAFQTKLADAIMFVKSVDGGETFTDPAVVQTIIPYDRSDQYVTGGTARDCGDGPFLCETNFTFHRTDTLPQAVADANGAVFVTWEELSPVADNGDTYHPDGQSRAVVSRSTDGGATWSAPSPIDPQPVGHQFWPNLEFDRTTKTLVAVYYDSRFDPGYSPYRPPGNLEGGISSCGVPGSPMCNVLNAFIAFSTDGVTWTPTRVSTVGHQPEYEMFGSTRVPFHGDYLWVDANGGRVFGVWTDNRDVVPGFDIRDPVPDGFDVHQCRATPTAPNTCPNEGGLNQNIYGFGGTLP